MKTAILTDSGANLTPEFISKNKNLFVIPLMIVIDGKEYRDGIDIQPQEVYNQLDNHQVSTSLPSGKDLEDALVKIKKAGFQQLVCVNISSGLSGTYNFFRLALQNETSLKIVHYDSKTLGGGLSLLVEEALRLANLDTTLDKYVPMLNQLRFSDSTAFYTINTLHYLRKGGRIGKVEGTIGDILHIKPVITVNDEGVYVTLSKAFGMKRSLISMKNILIEKFDHEPIEVIVHYGNNKEEAELQAEKLKDGLNITKLSLTQLTPVLGVHTGPDMLAFVARRK